MDKLVPGLIVAAVIVVLLGAMWRAWRRRSRLGAQHAPSAVPADFAEQSSHDVLYVATTEADAPLERLAVPGLAFRAAARLVVGASGLVIDVPGEEPAFVPADALRSVDTARVAIDRAVEADGLVRIAWTLPDGTPCDSYLRVRSAGEQPDVIHAISNLITTTPASPAGESENNA